MSTIQITDAGATLMQNSEGPIVLTSFKLGSHYGYTPTSGQTDIQGSLVYTGVPGAPVVQDANVILYPGYLQDNLGPFSFGEVGLFYNTTLFAILVLDTMETKTPFDPNTRLGGSLVIDFFVPMVGSNYQLWANVSQANVNKASVAQGPEALPYSVTANPNLWVVQAAGGGRSFLAYSDRQGLWNFNSFEPIQAASVISADTNSITISGSDAAGLTFSGLGKMLIQMKTGRAAASCRYVSAWTVNGGTGNVVLSLSAPMAVTAQTADLIEIYLPTASATDNGGGSYTPTPSLPSISSFAGSDLMRITVGSTEYKSTFDQFAGWLFPHYNVNRTPQNSNSTATSPDTGIQLTGNLYTNASDPDGDTLTLTSLSYNGTPESFSDGSFATALGVFFLNADTGDWNFTLGQGARKLNTGETGTEIFTYTLADGKGGIVTSTLTVFITGTNSVPVVNYVNNQTPINTTVTGNLIFNYAFDYETTPTVSQFLVTGDATVHAANGSPVTISGVGTLAISTSGDYTFVPQSNFTGPVPLVTYTVTDGVNNVPAFLTLAVTPMVPGTQPIILFSDIVSGPTSGGENNLGTYLTIWGFRFGSSGSLGSTTKLYIGGQEVANYRELVTDQLNARYTGMQRLTVQIGSIGNPTMGKPLPITLVTSGGTSNANNVFTPNPGRIFFVSLSGNDTTAVIGDINQPFRMLQYPSRGQRSVYSEMQAGDTIVLRGGNWSDLGYATCWFRFRDPQQQGSNPSGASGTGWMAFMPYPGEDVHYTTPAGGNSGGIEGPGDAFTGTCGDWVVVSKLRMEVVGGSSGAAAPVNMQYNTGHWRVVGNSFGPWVAGDSATLNAACVTGQGNFIVIAGNYMHDIEGTSAQQNHGIYAGTSSYGWEIMFNWMKNMVGGSHIQFNDSDGGTALFDTPYGVWQGFTGMRIHHNFLEHSAKYGITFSDIGAGAGDLSFQAWNNVIIGTGLAPLRLNTTTATSTGLYAFNTVWNCNQVNNVGTGNGVFRNEGNQQGPSHNIQAYNNILAFGPQTVAGTSWLVDPNGQDSGYDLQRNVYWANGQSPANPTDPLAIYGDPLFTNTSTLDFSLQSGSPAANSGTKSLGGALSVFDDFTGQATRLYGGAPDCGAFEIVQSTPYPITPPSFSGGPQNNVSSTVNVNQWGNSPTGYTLQFKLNGTNVGSLASGTTASYTPPVGSERQVLTCLVTATNGAGSSTYTVTLGAVANAPGAPTNTAIPSFTGTAQQGQTLHGANGSWTGTVTSYTYKWLRGTTVVGTAIDYTLQAGDIGATVVLQVTANDSATGSNVATSVASGVVSAAAADPTLVQFKTLVLTNNTVSTVTFDAPVSANNLIVMWCGGWDQAPYNFSISDSLSSSGFVFGTKTAINSNNPQSMFIWYKLTSSGSYTLTVNPNATAGAAIIVAEITGLDPSTILDIAQETSGNTTGPMTLASATPVTKHNDLILIGVAAGGINTITPGTGYSSVASVTDSTLFTLALHMRKLSAIETFNYTGTLSPDAGWLNHSLPIKGS